MFFIKVVMRSMLPQALLRFAAFAFTVWYLLFFFIPVQVAAVTTYIATLPFLRPFRFNTSSLVGQLLRFGFGT